ncbi:hypothetical protein, conserved [Trypanosoma brucei gambiense DAL972]|uniref:Uncharacterized protein n=1 Tax=Trypanosoma brucei gambiense (strain MHOM/CI/86/DAL972) TaxID=679716 RepID=C9ZJF5_TRYB9|nr:hypothetical protein, conserved [Trypanosoma brucei gambiense DAL972]CBH09514.1 hypothetical protein, conserved [Trypanosoma brucei gambiense DAL972]|eukprot:XP_011771819.1 hypothetical protein, conserved [Trypanosoma brucei gambiense DAL972]
MQSPKFGRRANMMKKAGESETSLKSLMGFATGTKHHRPRPKDEVVAKSNLRSLDDGVDEENRHQAESRQKEEVKRLVELVAEAPIGYAATLPKLAALDISNIWNDFLQAVHEDYDMSALTACLSQQLDDEDVPWNPDMLLVQLTSDMLDAAQATEGGSGLFASPDGREGAGSVDTSMAAAGEARRRRKQLLETAVEAQEESAARRRRQGGPALPDDTAAPSAPRAFATGDNVSGGHS